MIKGLSWEIRKSIFLAIDKSFGQLETWNIIKRRNYIRQLMLQWSQLILGVDFLKVPVRNSAFRPPNS